MAKRRKPGEGGVSLRKDGRWEGRVVIDYDDKGLPKTKNVLARSRGECIQKLDALKRSLAPATPISAAPDLPTGKWLELWLRDYAAHAVRPTTYQRYEELIEQYIVPGIGRIPLKALKRSDLQQLYLHLKEHGRKKDVERYGPGLAAHTIRNCHSLFRTALEQAVQEGLIPKNPTLHCQLPPSHPQEMQVLTPEEIQRLLIQAKEEGYYEVFLLEMATGLRRGELLALQWDDLNLKTGELRIVRQVKRVQRQLLLSQPKTKASGRALVLPPSVLAVLEEYRKTVDSRWIFPSPVKEDSPLDPDAVRKRLSLILEHAGCKHVRFHDLRHTFATNALGHGMDVKTLSAILGHVSASTTLNTYTHVTDEKRRTAAAKIDRGITGQEPPTDAPQKEPTPRSDFQAYTGKIRKRGTGCISQLGENLWEGRYSPKVNGKRIARNVYAHSREECETKLAELIQTMKAELAPLRTKAAHASPPVCDI